MSFDPNDSFADGDADELDAEHSVAPAGASRGPRGTPDDLDSVELSDRYAAAEGAVGHSRLASAFDDPEAAPEVDDTMIAEAEAEDLGAITAGGGLFDEARGAGIRDAFEDWAKLAQRHPPLSYEETDHLLLLAQAQDPAAPATAQAFLEAQRDDTALSPAQRERAAGLLRNLAPFNDKDVAQRATELLARHNIKWVIRCLRDRVGGQVMGTASDLRNDLLGEGNYGLLLAIQKFDHVAAVKSGTGHKKSLLEYARYWINNRVNKMMSRERFGLNQEAAEDRKKVLDALSAVRKDLEARRSSEEEALRASRRSAARDGLERALSVADTLAERRAEQADLLELIVAKLEQRARERCLAEDGIQDPTVADLRRRGALVRERVEDLLAHSTAKLSLDQPTDDEGEATLGQFVASSEGPDGDDFLEDATAMALREAVDSAPMELERKTLIMFAALNGMISDGRRARYSDLSPEDVARLGGRTRDSVLKYDVQTRRALVGDDGVEPDQLRRPRVPVTVAQVQERLRTGQGIDDATRTAIRRALSLREVLEASGVQFPDVDSDVALQCPFEDDGAVGRFLVRDDERYACGCCGAKGDVFTWLAARNKLSADEAVVAAARLANALPSDVERFTENGRELVRVTRFPRRKEAVRRSL